MTKEELQIVKNSWLFQELSMEEFHFFVKTTYSHFKCVGKRELLFWEEETINQIGIIVSGSMAIIKLYSNGNEHLFQKLGKGYILGAEIACTKTKMSPYSVQALEDSKIFTFSYDYLEEKRKLPEELRLKIQNHLLQFIASENIRKYYKINILSTHSLRERILLYLQIQKRKKGTNCFEIPFDRNQLANYLCVNRSALSKELSSMRSDGILKCYKNKFELLQ